MQVNELSDSSINVINGERFKSMLFSALMWLKEQQSLIDSLNVFPVPDGDTGTNMYLTFLEAVKEVKRQKTSDVSELTSALAKGALMGARGNSGVILSQLLRGFSLATKGSEAINRENLVDSLRKASEVAYQGVLKPVEGTILTVSREAAGGAELAYKSDLNIIGILENSIESARTALNKTPEQLPILKEAEVVDAGGQGYLVILEGMLKGLTGKKSFKQKDLEVVKPEKRKETTEEIKYAYCTEMMIQSGDDSSDIDQIRNDLQNYGDSLLVVGSDEIVKVHIHTNHPGIILEYGLKLGPINDIKIDNMRLQTQEKIQKKEEEQRKEFKAGKERGIIAVGQGKGLKGILTDLGVDIIIDGGQSMNPSTNDFVEAINQLNSSEIILLPNNKNVISAARQAASVTDKKVEVVPTKNIPQAIVSLLVFSEDQDLIQLKETMESELSTVKTAEITKAVKDSKLNGLKINRGDIIGLFNDSIRAVGRDYLTVIMDLLDEVAEEEELVTIYYGEGVNQKEAVQIKENMKSEFNFDEIEIYNGGQPLYPYIISLE